jgi:hypothetical protein
LDIKEPHDRKAGGRTNKMSDRDAFLEWIRTRLYDAELALHNGDAAPRLATGKPGPRDGRLGVWLGGVPLGDPPT